jgi:ComF family protein
MVRTLVPLLRNVKDAARRTGWEIRETLWPRRCAGCGLRGLWLCEECYRRLPVWTPPWCERCGVPVSIGCRCGDLPPMIDAARSVGQYSGWLNTSVRQLKYGQEPARAAHLGPMMARAISDLAPVDLLAPVPLHRRRFNERGYNQSDLLAEAIAHETGIPVASSAFRRVSNTPHQTSLSAQERRLNLRGAFEITEPATISGQYVLIVDDVFTTGSTTAEFASVLRRAGARWIGVVTVGRAMG